METAAIVGVVFTYIFGGMVLILLISILYYLRTIRGFSGMVGRRARFEGVEWEVTAATVEYGPSYRLSLELRPPIELKKELKQ